MSVSAFPRGDEPRPRIVLALLLGHLSGAYTYCLAMTVIAAVSEFCWRHVLGTERVGADELIYAAEDLVRIPVAAALVSPFAVFMMAPLTLLALPVALLSAHKLRTGWATTMALGGLTGLAVALAGLPYLSHSPPLRSRTPQEQRREPSSPA